MNIGTPCGSGFRTLMVSLSLLMSGTVASPVTFGSGENTPNTLSAKERKLHFHLWFNGHDLKGWKHSGNWAVEKGVISRTGNGGELVFVKTRVPDDFELRFEWKVLPGSNSGVYYRPGQYEYQILDNEKHPDGRNPRTSAASLYFGMAPSEDATARPGTWNRGRILCKGTVIQHWLNGKKVVDFDYSDPRWHAQVELLRLRGGDVKARGAYLHLQDHNDPVWYRSIRLRSIPDAEPLVSENITPQKITAAVRAAEQKKLKAILESRKK